MHDPAYIEMIARRIAWAHWKKLNPADAATDDLELWFALGKHHQDAYREAALAVASM